MPGLRSTIERLDKPSSYATAKVCDLPWMRHATMQR